MKQSEVFLDGEGKAWLERNKNKLPPKDDPVIASIMSQLIEPKRMLEVGCADGWRLRELKKIYKCISIGVDPSVVGVKHTTSDGIILHKGTANNLRMFHDNSFDLLIYGFCLYLCDPEDYFEIANEGNRVLADGGSLVIYDFYTGVPHSVPYKHKDGVFSHKMDFSQLWTCHPGYNLSSIQSNKGDGTAAITLIKKMHNCFPVMP